MPVRPSRALPPIGRSLYSRAILVDTGAFLALANIKDKNHWTPVECLKAIARHRLPIFVSVPTIYESYRRFLFDLGQRAAKTFVREVYDGSINIVRTVEEDEQEARRLLERYGGLALSLTDAANMAIMTRLGIAVAFSFDSDYLQAGFIRIPPFHL